MKKSVIQHSQSSISTLIGGIALLILLFVTGYFVINRDHILTFFTRASTCTNGAKKRQDTLWYTCVNGVWVEDQGSSGCTITCHYPDGCEGKKTVQDQRTWVCKNGSWVEDTNSSGTNSCSGTCPYTNATRTCNSQTYCCPGAGQQWSLGTCQSAVNTPPVVDTTTPQITDTKAPKKTGTNTNTGCPARQKNNKGTKAPKQPGQQGCNDYQCTNIQQGNSWAINDCSSGDADGDMQLCDAKGRIGTCGGKKLCCPGPGKKWTTSMTACSTEKTTLTVSPKSLKAGKSLTVKWTNIPSPSSLDWLAMYEKDQKDVRNPVEWNYVHSTGACTKDKGDGKEKGSCTFDIPEDVATGSYKLKLFSRDSYTLLAASTVFDIEGIIATPGGTPTPTPTGTEPPCCACPSPTPTYSVSSCNNACMTNKNCPSGSACLLINTYGWVCRSLSCPDASTCNCMISPTATPTLTPTVTPISQPIGGNSVALSCDQACTSTTQCKSGYQCVYLNGQSVAVCRNPKCYSSNTCMCPIALATSSPTPTFVTKGTDYLTETPTITPSGIATSTPTPTGLRLNALPSLTPSPTPVPVNPPLSVKPFTDALGKASSKFTLTGTSDPSVEITIQINPDAVGSTTTSDSKGNWRYILTKSLSPGNKELTVTARTDQGGETEVKQAFTVKRGSAFPSLFIGFLFLACIGGVGFFIYQKQTNDQSTLFSQFPPVVAEEEKPVVSSESPEKQPEQSETQTYEKPELPPDQDVEARGITTDIPEEKQNP